MQHAAAKKTQLKIHGFEKVTSSSLFPLSGLDMDLKQFKESGLSLSSLMIRDDVGQLVVGARGKVFALSLEDITKKTSEARPYPHTSDHNGLQ